MLETEIVEGEPSENTDENQHWITKNPLKVPASVA